MIIIQKFKIMMMMKIINLSNNIIFKFIINLIVFFSKTLPMGIGDWGLGIGDWGLGIGDWAQSPIPNPQTPIPQSPIPMSKIKKNFYLYYLKIIYKKIIK